MYDEDQIDAMKSELDEMVRTAESGEDWAEIAWLEAEIIRAKEEWNDANGQFGAGA